MIVLEDIQKLVSKRALETFLSGHYANDEENFVSDLSQSVNQLLHGDLIKAKEFVRAARKCFRFLPEKYRPVLLTMEARLAHWSGKHKAALNKYNQVIKKYQAQKAYDAIAKIRQGMMDVFMYQGKYAEALKAGKLALSYFQRAGKSISAARVMTNIGNVYHRMDRNKMALRYYDKARRVFASKGGVPLAIVDYNRANIFANLNNLAKAEKLYSSAAEIYKKHGLDLIAGKSEYSLAYLHFLAGRYSEALTSFDKVYDVFEKLGDTKAAAVTNLDLAEINIELNQFGTAMMQGEIASAVFSKLGHRYEEAKAIYFAAEASRRLGDYSQSEKYLSQARRLFVKEGNRFWLGMVALAKSRLFIETGRIGDAVREGMTARRLFVSNGDDRRTWDADIALMRAKLHRGSFSGVIKQGKQILRKKINQNQEYEVYCLIGECYLKFGKVREALNYFHQAVGTAEKMMSNLFGDEIRFFFALDKYKTYLSAVECLLKLDKPQEAFIRHSRALAVLNQRVIPDSVLKSEIPSQLIAQRKQLRASLKKLQKSPGEFQRRFLNTGQEVRKIEYNLWANEQKIRTAYTHAISPHHLPRWNEDTIQSYLKSDEVLINYVAVGSRLGAFVATRNSLDFAYLPASPSELRMTIHRLHYLMERDVLTSGRSRNNGKVNHYYLRQLHEWLIEPLLSKYKKSRLLFLIDGEFAQIPFLALPDAGGNRLKNRYQIKIIVNPDDLIHRQRNKSIVNKRSAVFAVTDTGLPMVEKEGHIIADAFPKSKLYIGNQATSIHLKQEFKRSRGYIHIASHASRASENPLFSRILMHDGPFFPFDLFESGIKAELISLSGCQTAAPGIYYGNAFSLAKAFYQAGVRFVLASLWSVSDKISMAFMTQFYHRLQTDTDIAAAFLSAMNQTEEINENPALWSPFILIGI